MKRFTEVLLLAAYTPFLLSFANGLQAMHSTVKHDAIQKSGTIGGLLDTRQIYYICLTGEYRCEVTNCCDIGWSCCSDGGCCEPKTYCDLASNGIIGCCPDGELCTGPAGDPTTVRPGPSPITTSFRTSTTTNRITTASTSTSRSTPTTTFTTLVGAPTQAVGETIVEVSALDVNITWSENWVQGTSSCSLSVTSKSTTTGGSSLTYILHYSAVQFYGFYYYFNVATYNTKWEIIINGILEGTYYSFDSTNCTYYESYFQPSGNGIITTSASHNFTLVVHGPDTIIDPNASGPFSLQFNKLLIRERNVASPSTTLAGRLPTGTALSASGRPQPYRPLLIFAGIFLALLYCA